MTKSIEQNYDSNLLKGTGLIEETLILLEAYEEGITKEALYKKVFELDLLSKSTEIRVKDIVQRVFFRRYWDKKIDIPLALKRLRENYVSMEVLRQIFTIYTCRVNPILHDFIVLNYWKSYDKGYEILSSEDYENFIKEAISDGRINKIWSKNTIHEVASRINSCLVDFNFINTKKELTNIYIINRTANYLAHELHFRGYSDNQILKHPDWKLFNLTEDKVVEILQRVSRQGHFILQYSGELLDISWKYTSMEKFINGLSY